MNQKFAVIIFGPTASGKTSLGIKIAQELNGVIINSDSRQIFQEMPIITAMPSEEEFASAPHKLFSFLKPDEKISVDKYLELAKRTCTDTFKQNKLPIFVGGTGFYLKVLTEGLSPIPLIPSDTVQKLTDKALKEGVETLYDELKLVDPELANKLKPKDTHRIIRGISVYQHTNNKLSDYQKISPTLPMPDVKFIKIALNPPREILYKRIHNRFDIMLEEGVIKEAKNLYNNGYIFNNQALSSLGLKELFNYITGKTPLEEAKEKTLQQTRRYAKRQITWLNNQYNPDIKLANCDDLNETINNIKKLLT